MESLALLAVGDTLHCVMLLEHISRTSSGKKNKKATTARSRAANKGYMYVFFIIIKLEVDILRPLS